MTDNDRILCQVLEQQLSLRLREGCRDVLLGSKQGMAIRFSESEMRPAMTLRRMSSRHPVRAISSKTIFAFS